MALNVGVDQDKIIRNILGIGVDLVVAEYGFKIICRNEAAESSYIKFG